MIFSVVTFETADTQITEIVKHRTGTVEATDAELCEMFGYNDIDAVYIDRIGTLESIQEVR